MRTASSPLAIEHPDSFACRQAAPATVALKQRAAHGSLSLPEVPPDFPSAHRFCDRYLFQAALGRRTLVPRSTWAYWVRTGRIPNPDKIVGRTRLWSELTVASVAAGDTETAVG